ncbi:potassium voltage-gated channel unc-103-like [Saccoglossus kowalevskii]
MGKLRRFCSRATQWLSFDHDPTGDGDADNTQVKLKLQRCTILHYTPFKATWDWLVLLLVVYTAIYTPFAVAFLLREKDGHFGGYDDPMHFIDLLVDIMFLIDILINFRTTYVDENLGEVVSSPKKIAMHYLRGWFVIDAVAAIPFDLLQFAIKTDEVMYEFPDYLQAEVCVHLNGKLLDNSGVFQSATEGCRRALCMKFKTTHTAPGDVLVHRGDVIMGLYFIARGSIEITDRDGATGILSANDVFGENICRFPVAGRSNYDVKSVTYCDLHLISREDLNTIFVIYQEFRDDFKENLELTFDLRDNIEDTIASSPVHSGQGTY